MSKLACQSNEHKHSLEDVKIFWRVPTDAHNLRPKLLKLVLVLPELSSFYCAARSARLYTAASHALSAQSLYMYVCQQSLRNSSTFQICNNFQICN